MVKATKKIPARLQGILWSADINKLDLERDRVYIIHQVLAYGRMEELQWLYSAYPKQTIIDTFLTHPYKDYRNARFHFVKDILLQLEDYNLDEKIYVKNIPRNLGRGKTESI